MSAIEVRLLGTVSTRRGGVDHVLTGRRQRAALAVLALAAGEPVRPDVLEARVWGDAVGSRANTQTAIARLRRELGPDAIRTEHGGYLLAVARDQVDVLALIDQVDLAAEAAAPHEERAALRAALRAWSAPPFGGEDLSDWLTDTESTRLLELRLRALERRIELDLRLNDSRGCTVELQELTREHPLRESLWALLIRSLTAEGRGAEALSTYENLRQVLAEELGADPSPALQSLHRGLLQPRPTAGGEDPTLVPGTEPPHRPPRHPPRQMPADVTDFSGRTHELALLERLIDLGRSLPDPGTAPGRLVIVHGPGGVGKSSLVVHAARRAAEVFPAGQLFVNLRGFGPGAGTAPRTAQEFMLRSVGVPGSRIPDDEEERAALVRSELGSRRLLIVLDDAHSSDQVRPLLPGGPSTVIVTSRRQLRGLAVSAGAERLPLEPMGADEATALLRHRLRAQSGSEPDDADHLSELAELCGHLPIALAVAAERAGRPGSGGVATLVRRLRDSRQRLHELSVESDALASVRAVFAPTYEDLPPDSQALFRVLSLHPNAPISTGAAAALAGQPGRDLERSLDRLTECHLLQVTAPGWCELHDLTRAFAAEQLDAHSPAAGEAARRRLASWALHSAEAACLALHRYPPVIGVGVLEPGVRPHSPASSDDALAWFSGHRTLLTRLIHDAADRGEHEVAHQLVPRVSYYLSRVGSDEEVALCELGLRCAMVLGSDREVGAAANNLGIAHGRRGRYEAAMTAFRTSLEHCIRADHRLGASRAQSNIALVLDRTGHTAEAASLLEELLADLAEWAEPEEALNDLNTLANCYTHLGRHPDALRTAHRLQEVAETLHSPLHLGLAEDAIGSAYLDLGQPEEACEALERARQLYLDTGDPAAGARTSRDLGLAHLAAGRPERARQEWQHCLRQLDALGAADGGALSRQEVLHLLADLPEGQRSRGGSAGS